MEITITKGLDGAKVFRIDDETAAIFRGGARELNPDSPLTLRQEIGNLERVYMTAGEILALADAIRKEMDK